MAAVVSAGGPSFFLSNWELCLRFDFPGVVDDSPDVRGGGEKAAVEFGDSSGAPGLLCKKILIMHVHS